MQGFPIRLAPGAPHSLRLLQGHPFCHKKDGQEQELAQQLLTQLAPEQQLAPAQVMSGEQLSAFKVKGRARKRLPLHHARVPAPATTNHGDVDRSFMLLHPALALADRAYMSVQVQTLDVWGNATCPSDVVPFEVALHCGAIDPTDSTFAVDDR